MTETLHVTLRPHIEGGGYHTDRFEAVLGGNVVHVGRSGWYGVARALLKLGYPSTQRLHVQHEGKPFDPTIQPRTIGDLAEWAVIESDRKGLLLRKWQPFGGMAPHPQNADSSVLVDAPGDDAGKKAPG